MRTKRGCKLTTSMNKTVLGITNTCPMLLVKMKTVTFYQLELNDLVRGIGLSKEGSGHLAAVSKKKKLLAKGTSAYFYRDREKKFRKFFDNDRENSLVYCSNVKGLVDELEPNTYKYEERRLFIDSSKKSLIAVLLHNGNTYAPIRNSPLDQT